MARKGYERKKITVGSRLKVLKPMAGQDKHGVPFWKFYVPFSNIINGQRVTYYHLWCKVYGKQIAQENEWVEIERIVEFYSSIDRNHAGGTTFFNGLTLEVRKCEKEDEE